jgi:hypothetical protein
LEIIKENSLKTHRKFKGMWLKPGISCTSIAPTPVVELVETKVGEIENQLVTGL